MILFRVVAFDSLAGHHYFVGSSRHYFIVYIGNAFSLFYGLSDINGVE